MTKEEKKQLEPALAPLRSLITKEDFIELALIYMQREMEYVICSVEKCRMENCLCLRCFYQESYPKEEGLVIITPRDTIVDLKKLLSAHPKYYWCHYFTYDNVDELLLWIQRDGEDLRAKYRTLTETAQNSLSFLNERRYGWWLKEN